jgi:hypothetical protein
MTIKKTYKVGDPVWIYGVNRANNKLAEGKVVYAFVLPNNDPANVQYVISVANLIEPLLEIRTWETISQDSRGPVGQFRELVSAEELDAVDKKLSQGGMTLSEDTFVETDEPTPEEIHAALERSQQAVAHAPLVINESKPKRRFSGTRKKK